MTRPTVDTGFTPCPSRIVDREGDDTVYGCMRPIEDGHTQTIGGLSHRNGGFSWTSGAVVEVDTSRCESLFAPRAGESVPEGTVWRCVEDAGHYPASVHVKHGRPSKAWTDEMSLNPPAPTPATDPAAAPAPAAPAAPEACGDRFVSPGTQREDAYVCDGKPGHLDAGVMHGGQNRHGKTAAWGGGAGLKDHPSEPTPIKLSQLRDTIQHQKHVIDQLAGQLEGQHRRVEALRQAVAWYNGANHGRLLDGERLSAIIATFERYLLDGTPVNALHPKGPAA